MQQNMGGMIKPTNSGSVTLPGSNAVNGMNQRNIGTPLNTADPMAMYRQFVENSASASTGGIKWEQYNAGGGFDKGLQEIANASGPDADSIQFMAQSVVQANLMFLTSILNRNGRFYEVYRQTVEGFKRSDITGNPCPVRDAFVTMFQKHQEFTRPVATNASPLFGWRLIMVKRESGRDELEAKEYLRAAEVAIRNVLFMEMVQWLMKTTEGQMHARQLPRDLAAKMPNISKFNEAIDTACAAFGVNNPYAGVTFEIVTPARSDLMNNRYEGIANQLYGGLNNTAGRREMDEPDDLFDYVLNNAAKAQGRDRVNPKYDQDDSSSFYGGGESWNKIRNDLENLTPKNKNEFQLDRFFHYIGKPKHYFIPETDWKAIKHAFKKHPEMKTELTAQEGCYRIVIIDLQADSGWFSTIVRSEKYDMPTLLTDPTKLLPLLDDPDGTGLLSVVAVPVADLIKDKSLEIPYEECRKLENKIPVLTLPEKVVTNDTRDLEKSLSIVNDRLTKNFTKENAVSFNALIHDTFSCASQEDKVRLFHDLPFLFKDSVMEKRPTWFSACKLLLVHFRQRVLDQEVCNFIDQRLTTIINDFLINSAGYDSYPHESNFLSVDSIVRDYDDLDKEFEANDPIMYGLFNDTSVNSYLNEQLKIFTYNDQFTPEGQELSVVEQVKHEQELVLERPLHITYINNRGGPLYSDANKPVIMKRSQFPEYFDLVEKSFEHTMGDASFDATDKLIMFTKSNNLWLFSNSAIDKNIATLRHVSRQDTLVLLPLN